LPASNTPRILPSSARSREQILADAKKQAAEQQREAEKKCAEMLASAKAQSQTYWDELSAKLNGLMKEHAEMRQLLSVLQSQGRDEKR